MTMEVKLRAEMLRKKKRVFGWIFIASTVVFFASNMLFSLSPMFPLPDPSPPVHVGPPGGPPPDSSPPSGSPNNSGDLDTAVMVSLVSLLTSITSLIGFFSTTVLAWRKEKREVISSNIEIKKNELELAKLRMELSKHEEDRNNESA